MKNRQPGYIFVLTMMIISLSVVLLTYITFKTSAFGPFAKATTDRYKAQQLALSGVQIAIAQLAKEPEKKQEEKPAAPPAPGGKQAAETDDTKDAIVLLKTLLPIKNQWQKFGLKKALDGIDGSIDLCIVSEDGKVDINALYDFEKHEFKKFDGAQGAAKDNLKKALEQLFDRIKQLMGGENLFPAFEKFLKDRQYKLHDITELLIVKEFEPFKNSVFYDPPEQKKEQAEGQKRPLYLTDIFTVWSGKQTVNPWLLSDSMAALFDLKRADGAEHKEEEFEILKKLKTKVTWPADWDALFAPMYGKTFGSLPKGMEHLLDTTFEATMFSVLSYGKVGKVTHKILAIVERAVSSQKDKQQIKVTIKKLYWL